jgi:hypothetical protein
LESVLNVLPPPQPGGAAGKTDPLSAAAADCSALEKLRQLLFPTEIVPCYRQTEIWPDK